MAFIEKAKMFYHQTILNQRRLGCIECNKDTGWWNKDDTDTVGGYIVCSEECLQKMVAVLGQEDFRIRSARRSLSIRKK